MELLLHGLHKYNNIQRIEQKLTSIQGMAYLLSPCSYNGWLAAAFHRYSAPRNPVITEPAQVYTGQPSTLLLSTYLETEAPCGLCFIIQTIAVEIVGWQFTQQTPSRNFLVIFPPEKNFLLVRCGHGICLRAVLMICISHRGTNNKWNLLIVWFREVVWCYQFCLFTENTHCYYHVFINWIILKATLSLHSIASCCSLLSLLWLLWHNTFIIIVVLQYAVMWDDLYWYLRMHTCHQPRNS